jgi:hypothetical protein
MSAMSIAVVTCTTCAEATLAMTSAASMNASAAETIGKRRWSVESLNLVMVGALRPQVCCRVQASQWALGEAV